jgi:arabinose-5-phosphate isomerase
VKNISSERILTTARKSIILEATTLSTLADSLDSGFVKAVTTLHACKGRIIVTGIGKSALIGKKIAATFNSVGAPAIFMHAGDALHGDLGVLQSDDVIIILSKSGGTPEIKALLPALKVRGNSIISIVGGLENSVANGSDIVILTPIEREVDPNNLAPTASSMAQLAIGDALAACLIHLSGFKSHDFAELHPAGMLGKQLNLRVKDLCTRHSRPFVSRQASVHQVIVEISSKRLGATAVLNEKSQLCGIITDGDIRRMLENVQDYRLLSAEQIMTVNPKSIEEDALAIVALKLMNQLNITQLLVVKGDEYIGVVHIHDLINEGF